MARILASLPERAVELAEEWPRARGVLLELLNREVIPMLRLLRRAVNGPLAPTDVKTADYALTLADELVIMGGTAALAATLPESAPIGHCSHIASVGSIPVTVTAPTDETVEGGATVALSVGRTSKYVKVTASAWHRLQ